MENIIELLMQHAKWIFSGIGIPIIAYLFFRKSSPQNITVLVEQNKNDGVIDEEIKHSDMNDRDSLNDLYRHKIGKKHKWLRESVFKLTLREMATFYDLEEVSKLESYESGEIELPIDLIKKLENFFFINPHVIDGDKPYIFQSFRLSQTSLSDLFEKGFSPIIACCPYEREDLLCFIVMHKEDNGFTRIIASNLIGSFASSGGGRTNIEYLIHELITRNMSEHDVSILKTTEEEWKNLEKNCYYDTELFHRFAAADTECYRVFSRWYSEAKRVRNIDHKTS